MRIKTYCLALILCLVQTGLYAASRVFSFTRYELKDGLAGMVVHGLSQDEDGFIWIATETGLSRFDGTHFRNFTIEDGLPGNEVLGTFVDSRNRVWISSFKNAICYYYKGKIYNQQNDTILGRIQLRSWISGFAETNDGNIILTIPRGAYVLRADGSYAAYLGIGKRPAWLCKRPAIKRSSHEVPLPLVDSMLRQQFLKQDPMYLWNTYNGGWVFAASQDSLWLPDEHYPGHTYALAAKQSICKRLIDDTLLAVSYMKGGVKIYDLRQRKYVANYMNTYKVHDVLKDREGNLWFSTNGMGLYLLKNPFVVNYTFGTAHQPAAVFGIYNEGSTIHLVTYQGKMWQLSFEAPFDASAANKLPRPYKPSVHHLAIPQYQPVSYTDIGLDRLLDVPIKAYGAIKTLFAFKDTLLLASSNGAFILSCLTCGL